MKYLNLLFFLAISITSYSQKLDRSIFKSDYEYQIFNTHLNQEDVDVLDLLICVDGDDQNKAKVENEIQRIIDKLETSGVRKKSTKAQIKQIYKVVHASILTRYDEEVFFSDIFNKGEYNCVTASALYAIVLDHFKIPYQIKETPTHVYLIGDPSETAILIESTNPSNGVVVYDSKTKKQYVDYLVDNKIISQMDVSTSSIDEVFENHYNKDTDINLYELTALQYYNKGVFAIKDENYMSASIYLEKSRLLYTSVNIEFMYKTAIQNLLSIEYQNKEYSAESLTRFVNDFSGTTEDVNFGLSYYENAVQELLIENSNITKFKAFQNGFVKGLDPNIDINIYMKVYYPKMGFYEYSQDNFSKSLEYFNLAYLGDTNNLRLKMAIQEMVARNVFTDKDHEAMIDTMNYYFDVYPFLYEREQYQKYYSYLHMYVIERALYSNSYDKAEKYLQALEPILLANGLGNEFQEYLEPLYLGVSSKYILKQQYNTAMSYLRRGLQLIPDSELLKESISEIKMYEKVASSNEIEVIKVKATPAEFSTQFSTHFPQCWESTKMTLDGVEVTIGNEDKIEIKASKYSKVTVTIEGETYTGRWTIRAKSKLLYLIPDDNKDQYTMFKIVSIDKNRLELRIYEGKSCSKESMVFTICD